MTRRTYGQHCGIARALELVGERWTLLIVRDLLLTPKRFTDLHRSLPRIPTNILTSRLKDLESNGIVQRRSLSHPKSTAVYELTSYGRDLEDVVLRLGRWGARSLGEPQEGTAGYIDPSMRALRATFRRERASDLRVNWELRFGDFVVHACVNRGSLDVGEGAPEVVDLVIDVGSSLTPLLAGDVTPQQAIESGRVRLAGDAALLDLFVEIFRMPPDWSMERTEIMGEGTNDVEP